MTKQTKTPARGAEPQSYGSQKDWVTGETGQTVDDGNAPPADPKHYHPEDGSKKSGPRDK